MMFVVYDLLTCDPMNSWVSYQIKLSRSKYLYKYKVKQSESRCIRYLSYGPSKLHLFIYRWVQKQTATFKNRLTFIKPYYNCCFEISFLS